VNVHITATARLANTTCNNGAAPRGRFMRYAAREIAALYPDANITWDWVETAQDFGITITPASPEVRYQIWATLHDAAQTPGAWNVHAPPPQPAPPPKPAGFVVPRSGFTPMPPPATVCHPAHVMLVQDDDGASHWIELDDDEARPALRSGFVTGS